MAISTNYTLNFTWDDIEALSKGTFGLRHVSSKEQLKKETLEGIFSGCSLAMVPQSCKFKELKEKKFKELDQEDQKLFLDCFQKAVNQFINISIFEDVPAIEPGVTQLEEFADVIKKCSFSIVDYSELIFVKPCDFEHRQYGGLGRFNKKHLSAKAVFPVNSITKANCGLEDQKNKVIESNKEAYDTIDKIVDAYRISILDSLRKVIANSVEIDKDQFIDL